MTTHTLERRVLKATVTQTPTDGKGTFDFEVFSFEVDQDNERIENFSNVGKQAISVPLDYQHIPEEADPLGTIGTARVSLGEKRLTGKGKLDIASNPMAVAVYERLLLPADDPGRLSELSIFYAFDMSKAYKGPKGEMVQRDCELLGIAVVHAGSQRTAIMNIKAGQKTAVGVHHTETYQGTWDAAANEARLPSPLPVAKARAAYAWIDTSAVENGEVPKSGAKFLHHTIDADGGVGGANLTACSAGIAVLNGGRGGTNVPNADFGGIHAHLAAHISDSGADAPPLKSEEKSLGTAFLDIVPRMTGPLADLLGAADGNGMAYDTTALVTKAGRVLSAKNETKLRQAHDLLAEVLKSVENTSEPDQAEGKVKAEEPAGLKAEEPTPTGWEAIRAQLG